MIADALDELRAGDEVTEQQRADRGIRGGELGRFFSAGPRSAHLRILPRLDRAEFSRGGCASSGGSTAKAWGCDQQESDSDDASGNHQLRCERRHGFDLSLPSWNALVFTSTSDDRFRARLDGRLPRPGADDRLDRSLQDSDRVDLRLKASTPAEVEPDLALEKSGRVMIVHDLGRARADSQEKREVRLDERIGRVRIVAPFQIPQRSLTLVAAAGTYPWAKRLAEMVRHQQTGPAGATVRERSLQSPPEVLSCRHVTQRILYEDGVESSVEANRPHVAFEVGALWIGGSTHVQHPRGNVDQSELKAALEKERVASAAASQLEDALRSAVHRE